MLLAALVLQASAAPFAPPLAAPLKVTSERSEGADRRYVMERLVRFARDGRGWRAEVRLLRAEGDAQEASGAMFEAGFAALAGRTIVFHLDAAGEVIAIDDMAALWEHFCARVAEMAVARKSLAAADRATLAARIAAPLRALPAERQRAMLGSLIASLVAEEGTMPGVEAVRVPGTSPFGGPLTLQGSRSTALLPGGLVRAVTRAEADIGAGGETGHVAIERTTEIDPRTGLIARSESVTRTRRGATEAMRSTILTVEAVPAEN